MYRQYMMNRYKTADAADDAAESHRAKVEGVLEGYQAAKALGPQGDKAAAIYAREYDQLRATAPKGLRLPSLQALNAAQKDGAGKDAKFEEVKPEGTLGLRGGQRVITDG